MAAGCLCSGSPYRLFLRFGDLKNHSIFEFYTIFHTKVLKDGPTPEISVMRVEDLRVGNMSADKETGGSGPLGIRNQAEDKKRGSNVRADFRCHQVGQKIGF